MTGPCHALRARVVAVAAIALALAGAGRVAWAQSPAPPTLTGPVNDFANVIDPEHERELERRILALQKASGDVVVVATVPSIEPSLDINDYAVRMFENGGRGIGQKGKDNGALIVLAMKERKVRVEVGYDLEEFITDGFAGETIREVMTPQFRSNAYGAGLVAGTTRIINRVASRRGVELTDVPRERQPIQAPRSFGSWKLILLVWINYSSRLILYAAAWAWTHPRAEAQRVAEPEAPVEGPPLPSIDELPADDDEGGKSRKGAFAAGAVAGAAAAAVIKSRTSGDAD